MTLMENTAIKISKDIKALVEKHNISPQQIKDELGLTMEEYEEQLRFGSLSQRLIMKTAIKDLLGISHY